MIGTDVVARLSVEAALGVPKTESTILEGGGQAPLPASPPPGAAR